MGLSCRLQLARQACRLFNTRTEQSLGRGSTAASCKYSSHLMSNQLSPVPMPDSHALVGKVGFNQASILKPALDASFVAGSSMVASIMSRHSSKSCSEDAQSLTPRNYMGFPTTTSLYMGVSGTWFALVWGIFHGNIACVSRKETQLRLFLDRPKLVLTQSCRYSLKTSGSFSSLARNAPHWPGNWEA